MRSAGYAEVLSVADPRQALPLFQLFEPDIVLLDLRMPHLDGFAVLEQLRARTPLDSYLPVLVLTADNSRAARDRALSSGARDFLTKPPDPAEVLLRVRNLLDTRFLHEELHGRMRGLEAQAAESSRALDRADRDLLERLTRAAEFRDFDTGSHARRVGTISALLAEALGWPEDRAALLRQAAPLHDIGKIGIPDSILLKAGPFTLEEYEVMKRHTVIGAGLLAGSRSPLLQMAEEIALYHHEGWDGSGYAHLVGPQTPMAARIVALADVVDALSHDRPYRPGWTFEAVAEHVQTQEGVRLDPQLVGAFRARLPAVQAVIQADGQAGPGASGGNGAGRSGRDRTTAATEGPGTSAPDGGAPAQPRLRLI